MLADKRHCIVHPRLAADSANAARYKTTAFCHDAFGKEEAWNAARLEMRTVAHPAPVPLEDSAVASDMPVLLRKDPSFKCGCSSSPATSSDCFLRCQRKRLVTMMATTSSAGAARTARITGCDHILPPACDPCTPSMLTPRTDCREAGAGAPQSVHRGKPLRKAAASGGAGG